MFKYARVIVPLSGALLLSACAGFQLGEAQKATPSGSDFNAALYSGYLELADSEFREADYPDSDVFAGRAMQAASNESVQPEAIAARDLPADKVGELSSAREQLVAALGAGAADLKPAEAARAQVMFDCWMQEQEENRQPKDIESCRAGFSTALAQIQQAPKVAAAAPAPQPAPALPGPYVVFFDFDKDDLTSDAKSVLAKVVSDAKKADVTMVLASGHADRAGDQAYNDSLAKRRADAVMSFLLESGLAKGKVLTDAYGENLPVVSTDDGMQEGRNRRVEIKFAK